VKRARIRLVAGLIGLVLVTVCNLSSGMEIRFMGLWNPKAPPITGNIALGAGGTLVGRVSDSSADSMPEVIVTVQQGPRVITRVLTAPDGFFMVPGLQSGVYGVNVGRTRYWYRCWAPGEAPPVCTSQVDITAQDRDVGTYNIGWASGNWYLYR
jgi:hypothetical protein